MTHTLDELILGFGDKARNLPDLSKLSSCCRREDFELAGICPNELFANAIDSAFISMASRLMEMKNRFLEISEENKYLSIAGRIMGHDLANSINLCGMTTGLIKHNHQLSDREIEDVSHHLIQIRLVGTAMAYLSTRGDVDFRSWLRLSRLEDLVRITQGNKVSMDSVADPEDTLRNDWYTCVCQCIKNAIKYGRDDGQEIQLSVQKKRSPLGKPYQVIDITDHGNGILFPNTESNRLANNLHKIYDGYTTQGTGLGCQIIAAFVDLENEKLSSEGISDHKANISVITKAESTDYAYYNRAENISAEGEDNIRNIVLPGFYVRPDIPEFDHGTRFRLSIPIVEVQDTNF